MAGAVEHELTEQAVAERVAAVVLADAGGLVEVGPWPLGLSLLRPVVSSDQVQAQRAELPGRENPVTGLVEDFLDEVERIVVERTVRLSRATRPLGVKRGHAYLVEPVDHLDRSVGQGLCTNPAMASALPPPAEASTTVDRRHFTIDVPDLRPLRRTIL